MRISISELQQKLIDILSQNFSADEATKITNYLIWAEKSGNKTQGIAKLTGTEPLQKITPEHEITIERDTQLSQLINGGSNPAPLVTQIATETVIEKAKAHGFGIVGVHDIHTSNGAQAYYAEQIARANLIGVVTSRSAAAVSAFGGIDPVLGTNPIGFSFPTESEPIVFDTATSAMTWYGLVVAKAKGEAIPENVALDHDGNPTTDPIAAMQGSIMSFDRSYKGSGFGLVSELLAGPLVKAAYGQVAGEWGSLLIAIDPNLLIDTADFKRGASDLLTKIKSARTKNDTSVRLPGESSTRSRLEADQSGFVEVDDAIYSQL